MKSDNHALDNSLRKLKKEAARDLEISHERGNLGYIKQRRDGAKRVEGMNHPRNYEWRTINDQELDF